MDLSIIIVNYNTESFLKKCLNSIISNTKDLKYEILVVDNNSTNRVIESFPKLYKDVKFYFLNSNNGFGCGCNYGSTKAVGKYFVFINPDLQIKNNALYDLFWFMEVNSSTGLVSGAFEDVNGKVMYSYNKFPNYKWELSQALGIGENQIIKKLLKQSEIYSERKQPLEVDWVYGACMLVRADVFKAINGFDEIFFLYSEDIDLQYRIRKYGYKVICLPYIKLIHFVNSSIQSEEEKTISGFYFNKSKIIYMYKYFNSFKRNLLRLIYILSFMVKILILPFRTKFKNKKIKRIIEYNKILKLYISSKDNIICYNPYASI